MLFEDLRSGLQKYEERRKQISGGKRARSEDFYFGQIPPVQDNQKTIRNANVPKGI